ncbi:heparinase II/III family protein [Pedobacter sp. BS3]|uniref:heparinase II/III domain-containing protein n=1 Tax=Pedobacter sp. BS3 TaxID=2567937 RepID=UPI001F5B0911|nr:heparinase II/III family protein [Pedobacter sp. BS3]
MMLTKGNVAAVRQGCQQYPLLKSSFIKVKADADKAINSPIEVPVPKDGGGGPTHEQHKRNYQNILNCGIAYQITGEKKYADYVRNILLKYADQYEKWPMHPKAKDEEPGRIFWQSLNDFVWQVHVIQGYDLVYDAIPATDRATIEQHLFMPILNFFTKDCYKTFNLIHNHGTWCLAAVGMTGYVLHKPEYVEMALKGSAKDGKTGYLAQLQQLFSPVGYYTEGPYYQRYAILPFVIFAKAIQQYQPQMHIYNYANGVLAKAINTSLQLTYTNGLFFPLNDAIKDKSFESVELVYGVDLAYSDMGGSADLLDIAQQQNQVIVSDAGLKVAKAVAEGKTQPFRYKSMWFRDGNKGDEGGLGVLRYGKNTDQQCVVVKAAAQGMGHGHFDRLNLLYYDHGTEVFSDYGSARFLNIDTKSGGGYLPENKSWAKQTVAHNTVVVDQTSHFKAKVGDAEKYYPKLLSFSDKPGLQVVSVKEEHAYKDVALVRTSILFKPEGADKELLIDVFKTLSDQPHQYDLPFWYQGHITDISFKTVFNSNNLQALGKDFGYQHLWLNAVSDVTDQGYITVLNNKRFYTTSFLAGKGMKVQFVTVGANDPQNNLRNEKAFILSQKANNGCSFISLTETHGATDPIAETVVGSVKRSGNLSLIKDDKQQTSFSFAYKKHTYTVTINYTDNTSNVQIN